MNHFRTIILLAFCAALFQVNRSTAQGKKKDPIQVVFYNVENLFDTINDPTTNDDEFTPDSSNHWTQPRYQKKLTDLAKVLSSITPNGLPEVVGLCEVENRQVVEDLFRTEALKGGNFKVIHEESADKRGIDVAMAYNAKCMKELYHQSIRFSFENDPEAATRDILYAKMLAKKDTLHFFVNHWPSRRGGQEASEPKRIKAASVVRSQIDSILVRDAKAKVIVMGDFNDHPNNNSMMETLNCEPGSGSGLTNLMYDRHLKGEGSYNYKGEWGMLDQFIVSDALLTSTKGYTTSTDAAFVYRPDWLLYFEEGKEPSPSKTYGGPKYYGGYSDHLPICIELK